MTLIIGASGSGKGGGGGGSPKEAKDNLESTSYARVLDLLCEGEIEGFATPAKASISRGTVEYDIESLKDIFYDNTPILNSAAVIRTVTYTQDASNIVCVFNGHGYSNDQQLELFVKTGAAINGTIKITSTTANTFTCASTNGQVTSGTAVVVRRNEFNYKDVKIFTRFGTSDQTRIPLGALASNEITVQQVVENGTPLTRTITDTDVDQVRVTITLPQLQQIQDDGDIVGSEVQLQIAIQYKGGGFETVINDTIKGRTNDQYQRSYLIDLRKKAPSDFPVQVRVRRVTPDSDSSKLSNSLVWTSYTEITRVRLNYRHSALVGTEISAEQFDRIPERKYRIRGMKVPIPSNGTVDLATGRIVYSGVWNGTFGTAKWTTDPAWCLWALLTNTRWGFGTHINSSQLDRWAFFSASKYCSELVDDGFGGQEPRFSCNVNIQTLTEAYKLVNDMCSVFRAMPYWSTGALTISQDKPADPAYLFTTANVTTEGFNYSGSDAKTRPNIAIVQYLNLETRDLGYEQVEDREAIKKYGAIPTEITAFACTSRGQASRAGEWLLYSSQYETEVVNFTASIEAGVVVRPGQLINIADPLRAGQRRGGRIVSGTATSLTVDSGAGLPASGNIKIIMPDGSVQSKACTVSGNTLSLASALTEVPNPGTIWIFEATGIQSSRWRVLTVEEQDGINYQITAVSYNASKYDYIERGAPLQFRDVTNLNRLAPAPTDLSLEEALYSYQGQIRSKLIITWRPVLNVNRYLVKWRKDSANWNQYTTQSPDHELLNITPGFFEIEVYSLNAQARPSTTALTGSVAALGKTAPPSNVQGLIFELDPQIGVTLSWNPVPDLDLKEYEIRRGSSWSSAEFVTYVQATSYKIGYLDNGLYTYLVKARDTSGVESATEASVTVGTVPPSQPTVSYTIAGSIAELQWTPSTGSYIPDYYDVRYGSSFASGVSIGTIKGTAVNIPITWAGARTFWVAAVDPVGNVGVAGSAVIDISLASVSGLTSAFANDQIVLSWSATPGSLPTVYYEIRRGDNFGTSTFITRIQSTTYTLKADWSQSTRFWVAAVNSADVVGPGTSTDVLVPPPLQPVLTQQVIDNNVLLKWQDCTTALPIVYYELRKGTTWATAAVIGTKQGRFTSVFEVVAGTYTYWLAGVDSAGNVGTPGSITTAVNQPPDYILQADHVSTFSGTKSNLVAVDGSQLGCVNTTETWQQHFANRGWNTPQDQINAGYPFYAMPSSSTGSYEETFDFGSVIPTSKITATLTPQAVVGTTAITPTLSVRKLVTDAWTNYAGVSEAFVSDFRYAKIRYDLTSGGGDDLLLLNGLTVKLDVKVKTDGGSGTANAADVGGTTVNFTIPFVDIQSITVTPSGTVARIAIYDFVDVPNPTSFKVLLYDLSGVRVSGGFSWTAKGA